MSVVIPPDRDAIRDAMKPPVRNRTKLAGILAILAVIAFVTALVLPDSSPPPQPPTNTDPSKSQYVDTYNHPVSYRFLVPIAPSKNGKPREIETSLRFGYSVTREDTQVARDAIKDNFSAAGRVISGVLRQRSRMEFVEDLESINEKVIDVLNAQLFPNAEGQVQTVNWDRFVFR